MATPLKALSDYVYVNRKDWISLEPIIRSLRVEPEELESLDSGVFEALIGNYSSRRVQVFLESLKKDLE